MAELDRCVEFMRTSAGRHAERTVPFRFGRAYMTDDLKIESVLTVEEHRRRGYARAVVAGALRESRVAGHELTFLTADEAEGPLALYSELGFVTVGRVWDFARESDG